MLRVLGVLAALAALLAWALLRSGETGAVTVVPTEVETPRDRPRAAPVSPTRRGPRTSLEKPAGTALEGAPDVEEVTPEEALAPGSVSVVVADERARPVVGWTVRLAVGRHGFDENPVKTRTDEAGLAFFPEVEPGAWFASVAPEDNRHQLHGHSTAVRVEAERDAEVEITVGSSLVRGRAVNLDRPEQILFCSLVPLNGIGEAEEERRSYWLSPWLDADPVEDSELDVSDPVPGAPRVAKPSSASGSFVLAGIQAGYYRYRVAESPDPATPFYVEVEVSVFGPEFVLPPMVLHTRDFDASYLARSQGISLEAANELLDQAEDR